MYKKKRLSNILTIALPLVGSHVFAQKTQPLIQRGDSGLCSRHIDFRALNDSMPVFKQSVLVFYTQDLNRFEAYAPLMLSVDSDAIGYKHWNINKTILFLFDGLVVVKRGHTRGY